MFCPLSEVSTNRGEKTSPVWRKRSNTTHNTRQPTDLTTKNNMFWSCVHKLARVTYWAALGYLVCSSSAPSAKLSATTALWLEDTRSQDSVFRFLGRRGWWVLRRVEKSSHGWQENTFVVIAGIHLVPAASRDQQGLVIQATMSSIHQIGNVTNASKLRFHIFSAYIRTAEEILLSLIYIECIIRRVVTTKRLFIVQITTYCISLGNQAGKNNGHSIDYR